MSTLWCLFLALLDLHLRKVHPTYSVFQHQVFEVSMFFSSSVIVNVYREHNLDGVVGKSIYRSA